MQRKPASIESELRAVVEASGRRVNSKLEQYLSALGSIASVAPLLGLFGTVIGMIKSFLEISQGNFEGIRQMKLASGVSEALVTTAVGLGVAIVAVWFYNYFSTKIDDMTIDIDGIDPAWAPGTGVPEIGGLTPREVQVMVRSLQGKDLVGGDICEVAPCFDPTGITAVTAANLMWEMLCILADSKARRG